MIFEYSDGQRMLRETLARYLARTHGFDRRMKAIASPLGRDPDLWRGFAVELGILGAPFPERLGGIGGGAVENMIVMEELGAALAVEPYLETVVVGGGLLAAAGGKAAEALIPALIDGEILLAIACAETGTFDNSADLRSTAERKDGQWRLNGRKILVHGAPWATHYLVSARTSGARREREGVSLFLVDAESAHVTRRDGRTADGRVVSEIGFDGIRIPGSSLIGEEGAAVPLLEQAFDEAAAAICAEALGVLRCLSTGTNEYTKQRRQFGQPLASFQVLRHRMADMFIAFELCASLTLRATLMLDRPAAERAAAVSQAKVTVARACRFIGQNAVQIHGGMGLTADLAIGHYFKRATAIESRFGSADFHLRRLERLADAAPQA